MPHTCSAGTDKKSAFILCDAAPAAIALRSVDLARTQATGANGYGLRRTVNDCLYLTDVRLPHSVGLAMRVRNRLSENNTLSADATLCHIDTSSMRCRACIFHENP